MIKKPQKWIAMFVAIAFVWLLQVSTMPLRGEQSPAQAETAVSSPDQGPSYIEEEGAPGSGGKKSIVPMVLIGLGVVAVAAVLVLVVFKTKYDPVGTWSGPFTSISPQTWTATLVFTGDKKSGTVKYTDPWTTNAPGTYSVDGKKITMTTENNGDTINWTGEFTSKDAMNGTWTNIDAGGFNGTWSVTRTATAALPPAPLSTPGGSGMNKKNK